MKKILIPVALLILGLGFVGVKKLKQFSDQVRYEIKDFHIDKKKTNLTQITLSLTLSIINPSSASITIENFIADVRYKGQVLTRINNFQKVLIKAKAITNITIPVVLSPVNLGLSVATALLDAIKNKTNPVVEIKGDINFANGSLKVNTVKTLAIV